MVSLVFFRLRKIYLPIIPTQRKIYLTVLPVQRRFWGLCLNENDKVVRRLARGIRRKDLRTALTVALVLRLPGDYLPWGLGG